MSVRSRVAVCFLTSAVLCVTGMGAASAAPRLTVASVAASPSVTAITPSTQAGESQLEVDITGSGFTGTTQVTFGDVPVHAFQVLSDTEISAVTPLHANGAVDVTVTTPHGAFTLPSAYNYTDPNEQTVYPVIDVPAFTNRIFGEQCPAETPYLEKYDGDPVTGYDQRDNNTGVQLFTKPQYGTGADGYAIGVVINYWNSDWEEHHVQPAMHCVSSKNMSFKPALDHVQIAGPSAPDPRTALPGDMLEPILSNSTDSDLKITNVWVTNSDGSQFIDGDMPKVGEVIAHGGELAANFRPGFVSPTLHVRATDDHGDVVETSVSGLSADLTPGYGCQDTAGSNLQCHPKAKGQTIVEIENAG